MEKKNLVISTISLLYKKRENNISELMNITTVDF